MSGGDCSGDYLTTSEVAKQCGVSSKTVGRWVDAGALAAVFTAGGHRRILAGDVEQFLRERRSLHSVDNSAAALRVAVLSGAPSVQRIVRRTARLFGAQVENGSNAFSAGFLVGGQRPQLVFVDCDLAGADANAVCQFLRATVEKRQIFVVALTDGVSGSARAQLRDAGAHHVLSKPIQLEACKQVFALALTFQGL